jgi:iron(III) transport system substrate-binding protein
MEKFLMKMRFSCTVACLGLMVMAFGFTSLTADAAEPTRDEIIKLAQKEGSLTIYSNSSRHSIAGEEFQKKYGIKVISTQLKDVEIIEKISKEAVAKLKGADLVFVQDSGRVYGELIKPGYVSNYMPLSLVNKIAKEDQNPLPFIFLMKTFIYNSEKDEKAPISNIWQLADPEWAGRFQMKAPFQEGVNMNFLTMLTKPDIADRIAAAYKAHYGKEIKLTTKNAGYEWINAVFNNKLIQGNSDTKISEAIGVPGQKKQLVGLFTANKLRMSDRKKLDLRIVEKMEPFIGFYYPMYALVPSNAVNTNAAKLFIEYVLTPEGFNPWANSIGDYSPNPDVIVEKGDKPFAEWRKLLIHEDPEWCFEHRADVEDFLNGIL